MAQVLVFGPDGRPMFWKERGDNTEYVCCSDSITDFPAEPVPPQPTDVRGKRYILVEGFDVTKMSDGCGYVRIIQRKNVHPDDLHHRPYVPVEWRDEEEKNVRVIDGQEWWRILDQNGNPT